MKRELSGKPKDQSHSFIRTTRELGSDEDPEAFDRVFKSSRPAQETA